MCRAQSCLDTALQSLLVKRSMRNRMNGQQHAECHDLQAFVLRRNSLMLR